jgi:hypothetical protein
VLVPELVHVGLCCPHLVQPVGAAAASKNRASTQQGACSPDWSVLFVMTGSDVYMLEKMFGELDCVFITLVLALART